MAWRHPLPAADVLIEAPDRRIVLIRRRNAPLGWAFPGGFVEAGEKIERAAVREAREETGLDVELTRLFQVYSDPSRDPRHHTMTVVYLGRATGVPCAGDDAAEAAAFRLEDVPGDLAFDHHQILVDYIAYLRTGAVPPPRLREAGRLSAADRGALLAVARDAIAARLGGDSRALGTAPADGPLARPGGAFVSLHENGALRGCIGTFADDRPLHRVVHDMAIAAAFDDPRFPPLDELTLATVDIEISVLSASERAVLEDVVAGWHGVSVSNGGRKGVFLPQVAREEGWSREMLLRQTCLKAGLSPDAWREPETEVRVFTAEVFGERATR